MSVELVITIFVLMALTIPAAIGGVFVFRGTYYKSLPGRIHELEEDSIRKDTALKRQATELELWKGVATQTPEIKKLLELYETHDRRAEARFTQVDKQHGEILRHLLKIEAYIDERDHGNGSN